MRRQSLAVPLLLALLAATPSRAQPPAAPSEEVARWVERLGADAWEEREEAERRLVAIGADAIGALEAAAASDDPETQWRALRVLRAVRWRIPEGVSDDLRASLEGYERLDDSGRLAALRELLAQAGEGGAPIWETVLRTETDPDRLALSWDCLQRFAAGADLERFAGFLSARAEPQPRWVVTWILDQQGRELEAHRLRMELWRTDPANERWIPEVEGSLRNLQDWAGVCEFLGRTRDPADDTQLTRYAEALLRSGRTDEALALVERALAETPDALQRRWTKGIILIEAGRTAEGVEALLPLVPEADFDPLWHNLARVWREARAGDAAPGADIREGNARAIESLRGLAASGGLGRPQQQELRLRLHLEAHLAREAEDAEAQTRALRDALAVEGAGLGDRIRCARRLLDMDRPAEAAAVARAAPADAGGNLELEALAAAAEPAETRQAALDRLLQRVNDAAGEEAPQVAARIGELLTAYGWTEGARFTFAWGVERTRDPVMRAILLERAAEAWAVAGNDEAAVQALEEAVEAARRSPDLYGSGYRQLRRSRAIAASRVREAAGDAQGAWDLLAAEWEIDRSDIDVRTRMAQIARDAGWKDRLEGILDELGDATARMQEAFPRAARHANNLAWAYASVGERLIEAEALAREALRLEPDETAYLDTLAETLYRQGRTGEAVALESRALALVPSTSAAGFFRRQIARFRTGSPKDPIE